MRVILVWKFSMFAARCLKHKPQQKWELKNDILILSHNCLNEPSTLLWSSNSTSEYNVTTPTTTTMP